MKKGFTLIELLAVIVILAIIALIATPIILGIINDARDSARERTAELVAKEVELAYTGYMYNNDGNEPKNFCEYMDKKYFTMSNADLGTCSGNSVVVTSKDSEEGFTVTDKGNGSIEVTGAKNIKTVTLTK